MSEREAYPMWTGPKTVYEATDTVPELGIEVGDVITLRPAHPTNPFLVTRRHLREEIVTAATYRERLSVISGEDLLEEMAATRFQVVR